MNDQNLITRVKEGLKGFAEFAVSHPFPTSGGYIPFPSGAMLYRDGLREGAITEDSSDEEVMRYLAQGSHLPVIIERFVNAFYCLIE